MNSPSLLSVHNICKSFGKKRAFKAVNNVSFELKEGEFLGLLGPNGAGKTTIIQMLLGALSCDTGSILYFGKELKKHRSEILEQVVFASTYSSLPELLTLEQNLEIFGRLQGLSKQTIRQRMPPLLDRFGLSSRRKTCVRGLSAGQMTRLMLVKAFLPSPRIMLLDEPTASLDPDVAQEVCNFLLEEKKNRNLAIIFTSHRMEEASFLCDRILFLQKGEIIANDLPSRLAQKVALSKVQFFKVEHISRLEQFLLSAQHSFRSDASGIEIEIEEDKIAPLLSAMAKQNLHYRNIKISTPTLEDYFLKMVKPE